VTAVPAPEQPTPSGYASPAYVAAVTAAGRLRELPRSGAFVIERPVAVPDGDGGDGHGAGGAPRDAMGAYPLLSCPRWRELGADLDALAAGGGIVSLVAVTDPFGDHDPAGLRRAFPDLVTPYKPHFVVDLGRPLASFVSDHHRRYARAAGRGLEVERCAAPADYLDEWTALYGALVRRHGISGIAAFSRASFAAQLAVPGCQLFRARGGDATLGMLLWYRQGETAYYHLGAYSEDGYQRRASFPLFWRAFEALAADGVRWLDLGAAAGAQVSASATDAGGLARFKRGWSTGTRPTYLCGRIFDRPLYAELTRARGVGPTSYFPAYREGEFV